MVQCLQLQKKPASSHCPGGDPRADLGGPPLRGEGEPAPLLLPPGQKLVFYKMIACR